VVLDQTLFYAESGTNYDRGYLSGDTVLVRIDDVKQQSGIYIHYGRIERGRLRLGEPVMAQIDRACRVRAQAKHRYTPTASGAKEDC